MKRVEWKSIKLGEVITFQRGFDLPSSQRLPGGVPVISSGGQTGWHKEAKVPSPGIVTGRYGSVGEVYYIHKPFWPLNTTLFVSDFHGNFPLYIFYLLQSLDFFRFSDKTGVPGVNRNDLHRIRIEHPPLPEQKKIAEILSTWDEAIELTRRLIDAKKQRKKALIQKLLSGKKRLPGFGKTTNDIYRFPLDWRILRAREIFEIYSAKNCGHEPVLSVTQDEGVVHRNSLDRRIKTSEANTNSYKLVEPGDFVISLRSFQGGLEFSQYRGVVSPAYHVIRPKIEIDNVFYKYYFKSYDFIGHLAVAVIGIRDGKQISFDDFAHMYLPSPPINEQKAIGNILSTSDEEVKIHEQKLATLEKQKCGLMQKLLTGEIRVKT